MKSLRAIASKTVGIILFELDDCSVIDNIVWAAGKFPSF